MEISRSTPLGLGLADDEGNLIAFNAAMLRPGAYEREDMEAIRNVAALYDDPAERARVLALAHRQGGLDRHEVQFRRKAGGRYPALLSLVRVQVKGRPCWQAIVEDLTERKQREGELEAIARMGAALRTARSRAEMLPVILDQLAGLLGAEGTALDTLDAQSGEIVTELAGGAWTAATGLRVPSGQGLNAHVVRTGRPYRNGHSPGSLGAIGSEHVGGLQAVACVPLITREQTLGVLWVGRTTPIPDSELRLLASIADIAANALQRAALHEQTESRLLQLTALHAIDAAITASMDLRLVLAVLLDHVTALTQADAADLLLLDPHTLVLSYAAGRGFRTRTIERSRVRLGDGLSGTAALERRALATPNLNSSEPEFARARLLAGEGFVSHHVIPLIAKGHVKGVLEVFHRTPSRLDPDALEFLETLASQAAIAMDYAAMFEDLQASHAGLALAYDSTIEGWSRALELRDRETEGHSQRVTELTLRLARAMGLSESELVHVRRGALLHDIGKMGIPDSILLKPEALTKDEWAAMRLHPTHAFEMLSPIVYLRPALDIPYCHHERWDGTGYPRQSKGEEIPLAARIFAVADVWDALRSERPYRPAWNEEQVLDHIQALTGSHFDPKVVEVFLSAYRTPDE